MVPQNAINLCKTFEGFRSKPYLCPAGVPTIGYGSTRYLNGRKVTLKDAPVDKSTAEALLDRELMRCIAGMIRHCPVLLTESPDKLGAIADFCYNLGVGRLQCSTLRRRINQRNWQGAIKELNRWVYGGGRKLRGLVMRRAAESKFMRLS